MDVMPALKQVVTEAVADHSLFKQLDARQQELLANAQTVLSAVIDGQLEPRLFKRMISSMRRFDLAVAHLHAGITASLTDVDELTGLLNRTAMGRDLTRELAQAKRTGKPLCLAMIDADHFKKVNDDYGHSFGDTVLEELADRFETSLRPRDRIYRFGGEELLVALPDTGLPQAEKVMERIRIRSCEKPISEDDISITQTV